MSQHIISVREFSKDPDLRYRNEEDDKSAEEFRDDYVIPCLEKLTDNEKLIIDLDGPRSISASFLEELFGGLVRKNALGEKWNNQIDIISNTVPEYKDSAIRYIAKALKR